MLDALREHDVRATFFLIDAHITPNTTALVKRIADEGHAIGLHSGSRRPMIDGTRRFRPPPCSGQPPTSPRSPGASHAGCSGRTPAGAAATMYDGLERAGYRLAGWSWGMWDWDWWRQPRSDRVTRRLERKASPGDIIVIHDGHHKNPDADRSHAAETVRRLVPILKAKGFSFRGLCE